MKTRIISCRQCGKMFEATKQGMLYCGPDCKAVAASERDKRNYYKNKELKNRPRVRTKKKTLAELEAEARAAGMHYGAYVAMLEGRIKG